MTELYENLISRQIEIFSSQEQEKLRFTKVTIVGCGGLGGSVIEQLVRAGFENMKIIDSDVFDQTNLNRQIRSNLDAIGQSKVQVTKSAMLKINSNLVLDVFEGIINQENAHEILDGSDIVIDAVDNVLTRVIISRTCKELNIPFVHAAIESTQGQLTIFTNKSPSYEELFNLKSKNKELSGDVEKYLLKISMKKPQVLGTTAAIFGTLEVVETIKFILNKEHLTVSPKVLMGDVLNMASFKIIDF
ncbi:MAG: HesA/MoeB/ThiF family protein [Methanosphaera stadtmanae]|nr:HesA/MoeB/ThiF family protein [Methanosphaera stadtmanae]